jgi:bifunctional non-homologous end joining protein LigD
VADSSIVEIQDKRLKLSNLEKVLYPGVGFTKGQVLDYYVRIAPFLLPHLHGRPLTLKRYPDGVDAEYFYEKNAPSHRPEWVKTAPVWSRQNRRDMHFILAEDLPTLVWLANLASLELHTSLSLARDALCPTTMVFDLDPGPPANLVQCARVGLWLKEIFDHFGLASFPKTSGSKGLQVYVPLNTAVTYEKTKMLAQALAQLLEHEHPGLVVSEMKKELRGGKVFIDWSQNDDHKTTVSVYSLRAREHPTVSTPVTWEEVDRCLKTKTPLVFETAEVLKRCGKMGDLFAPVLSLKQKLPELAAMGASAAAATRVDLAAQAEKPAPRPKGRARSASRKNAPAAKKRRV